MTQEHIIITEEIVKPAVEMHWGLLAPDEWIPPTTPGTVYKVDDGPWMIVAEDGTHQLHEIPERTYRQIHPTKEASK